MHASVTPTIIGMVDANQGGRQLKSMCGHQAGNAEDEQDVLDTAAQQVPHGDIALSTQG